MCVKNMQIYSSSLDRKVMSWLKEDFFAIALKGPGMKKVMVECGAGTHNEYTRTLNTS